MQFPQLFTLLILGLSGSFALPAENKIEAVAQVTVASGGPSQDVTLAKRAGGVDGTMHVTWHSKTSFSAWFSLSDTGCDGHAVYIEAEAYLVSGGSPYVLRCNNNNGCGNTITCDSRAYSNSGIIRAVISHACVNVQLGSDICAFSGTLTNPYY